MSKKRVTIIGIILLISFSFAGYVKGYYKRNGDY